MVSESGSLPYILIAKLFLVATTSLLFAISCLRCSRLRGRRLNVSTSASSSALPQYDQADCPIPARVNKLSKCRPLSDLSPAVRGRIWELPEYDFVRCKSNSELYASVDRDAPAYCSNVAHSARCPWQPEAYCEIAEKTEEHKSDNVYSQIQGGNDLYDNVDEDIYSVAKTDKVTTVSCYDYPHFNPLHSANGQVSNSRPSKAASTDLRLLKPTQLLSKSTSGEAVPMYAAIKKDGRNGMSTLYVAGRVHPLSEPSVSSPQYYDAEYDARRSAANRSRQNGSDSAERKSSYNYRYLSMRESLEVLRRRLELNEPPVNVFNSLSDNSLHHYTYINDASEHGYEAVPPLTSAVQLTSHGESTVPGATNGALHIEIRHSGRQVATNAEPMSDGDRERLVLNVGGDVHNSGESDIYEEYSNRT